jgi:hypothetical protein
MKTVGKIESQLFFAFCRERKRGTVGRTDEAHRETEDTAKIRNDNQLEQVVNGRVDPSTTLRKEDRERVGNDRLTHRLRAEHHLPPRERPQHERREVTIFSEKEEVLLVKRVDDVLRVVRDDVRVGEDRDPVPVAAFRGFDAVHRETTGETGYAAEHGLEGFGEVVGDVVLEDCGQGKESIRRKGREGKKKKAHLESS